MLDLIGNLFEFALDMAMMAFDLVFSAAGLVFDILGGFLSLVLGVSVIGLIAGLLAVVRIKKTKPATHAHSEVDDEEFVSFYDQFRTQE